MNRVELKQRLTARCGSPHVCLRANVLEVMFMASPFDFFRRALNFWTVCQEM
jgi:hypothetical protein